MALPRRGFLAWLVIPVLGAGTLWWVLASKADREQATDRKTEPAGALAHRSGGGSRVSEAVKLGASSGLTATNDIVQAYGSWANDGASIQARKLLLSKLFAEPDTAKKLAGVLAAVEADPTPPEKDPFWEHIVTSLADVWKGEVATIGMDLVVAETRPRARRALLSSLAEVATSERLAAFTAAQRQTLTETMIDLSVHVPTAQRPEIGEALRKLGGNDLADIMEGKGVTGKDGHVLESERAYEEGLAEATRIAQGQKVE
jgi:hypothetical protein